MLPAAESRSSRLTVAPVERKPRLAATAAAAAAAAPLNPAPVDTDADQLMLLQLMQ